MEQRVAFPDVRSVKIQHKGHGVRTAILAAVLVGTVLGVLTVIANATGLGD